jgi:hypothetical protein
MRLRRKKNVGAMNVLRQFTTSQLDDWFRQVTAAAAERTFAKGLPVTGLDHQGRIVSTREPLKASTERDQDDPMRQSAEHRTNHV